MSDHREKRPPVGQRPVPYGKRYVGGYRKLPRKWVTPALVIGVVGLIIALLAATL